MRHLWGTIIVLSILSFEKVCCQIPSDTIVRSSVCIGSQQVLTATVAGDAYMWTKDGQPLDFDTRTIIINADETATYVCSIAEKTVSALHNLMANGDFEANPPVGFTSDYQYAGWNPSQYYATHGGASNLYTITQDASYFWKDFYPVRPHGGNYFALFDAGKSGYAWKAETSNNPQLILEKDSAYLFSYWAAYPNKSPNNSPARLQFVIICKDPAGQTHTYNLGAPHTLGNISPLNAWELQEITWIAPVSSAEVTIGVYDQNQSEGGNDFCLDDIMFQKTTMVDNVVIHECVFIIEPHDCTPPCPAVQTDEQSVLLCDTLLPYLWEGYTFTQPDTMQWIEYSPRGCDSILHIRVLDTLHCERPLPPSPVCYDNMLYAKWEDVLFCDNAADMFVSYQWYCNGAPLTGENKQFLYFPSTQGVATQTALFHVCAATLAGEEHCSCQLPYADIPRSADTYNQQPPFRICIVGNRVQINLSDSVWQEYVLFAPNGMLLSVGKLLLGDNWLTIAGEGVYLLRLYSTTGQSQLHKLIAK